MAYNYSASLRATQRAPRSCISCSARKIRCDKAVPCSACIRRGEASTCTREVVVVRGRVTTFKEGGSIPTYEELKSDNQQLLRAIASLKRPSQERRRRKQAAEDCVSLRIADTITDELEDKLWARLSAASTEKNSSISSWRDIVMPTQRCSEALVAYDKSWNSWVHYAVEYPQFEQECDVFMRDFQRGSLLDSVNPLWLAVYFAVLSAALLMLDDADPAITLLPCALGRQKTSKIWYDASIFCLQRGNFMQAPNARSVQAIAILCMCFHAWGDAELADHMRSCAIRIAQRLWLIKPSPSPVQPCLSQEGQCRLWWTLIICDWLEFAHRPTTIEPIDFNMALPSVSAPGTDGESPDPVHYHIFMVRTATAMYHFRSGLRSDLRTLDGIVQLVRTVDAELAGIIDTLPRHLQPENDGDEDVRGIEEDYPWVKWQRFDISLVLLHFRMRVNRTLQEQWLARPEEYDWARMVCVNSAKSVIWINHNWDQPHSMRKQWALAYHIFNSAVLLVRECQRVPGDAPYYDESIKVSLELLDEVKHQNAVAHHAAQILREWIG